MFDTSGAINAARIDESIRTLEQYLDADAIAPLLERLRQLAQRPDDRARLERLFETIDGMGIMQGAALTYAPYLAILLSERQAQESEQQSEQQSGQQPHEQSDEQPLSDR